MTEPTQTNETILTPPAATGGEKPPEGTPQPGTQEVPPKKPDGTETKTPPNGDAPKPEDGKKPAEPAKPEASDVEVKLPEGMPADENLVGALKAVAKEYGLKSEGAQKLVDAYAKAQQTAHERDRETWAQQVKGWETELKSDKEFGGAQFEANQLAARKAVERFGSPALRSFLKDSGLGNHPELVRAFARVGKALSEDTLQGPSAPVALDTEEARLKRNYPSMFKEQA